ncbi:MAG: type II secretion system GspH family protein, partial [Gemmataceae bacterium]|nr:type II secretion system GspH family protein [Gemmataceae bacterium]
MRRRAFSLLELIVVLAILATMVALSLPALQRARAMAVRMACANNLRQIGLAVHSAYDGQGELPHARACPAPWRDGADPLCRTLPTPDTWTGPGERWWAPYDNRPGATPTKALPGIAPEGFLWEFVGKDARLFHCPLALDRTEGSPAHGQAFQVAYALNPDAGGKRLNDHGAPW